MTTLTTYILDGKVDLFDVAAKADWHIGSLVSHLKTLGYTYAEADHFARFTFAAYAELHGGATDGPAKDCVPRTQLNRIQPSW